jgi:hypothetical protein
MGYIVAGPLVAIVGIMAIFFVLRRKSVEKRSMYSARRSQIEHKVRAARQRTLAPHGHVEKPAEPAPGATTAQSFPQPTVTWERTAFEPPPVAPPPAPRAAPPAPPTQEPVAQPPWEMPPSAPAPAPSSFDFPAPATTDPYQVPTAEPFRPAPEPTPRQSPSEPAWTPAPRPAEPLAPAEQERPAVAASSTAAASSATAAGSWSVVSTTKDSAVVGETSGKRRKGGDPGATSMWQLASGEAPDVDEGDEGEVRTMNRTIVAVAQYAVLVVGLVMVLIGVLVMVANSHVT